MEDVFRFSKQACRTLNVSREFTDDQTDPEGSCGESVLLSDHALPNATCR
jgi:hypothetical protein